MIDELGLGITVVARAGYTFLDEWQSFLCWFSVQRHLPDAAFTLDLHGDNVVGKQLYQWARRVRVPTRWRPPSEGIFLKVPCRAVLIRPYEPVMVEGLAKESNPQMTPAKSQEWAYWVDAGECGRFKDSDWLHRTDCPLYAADRFATPDLSVSEDKVLRLWGQACSLFVAISRG